MTGVTSVRVIAGMDVCNESMAGSCKVEVGGHDKCQVTVFAAASRAMNRTGVGIEFLLECLEGSVGGLPCDLSQRGMWKGEKRS